MSAKNWMPVFLIGLLFCDLSTQANEVLVQDTFRIVYGETPFMIAIDPVMYNGHTPWPDDQSQSNGAEYYRLDYERLEDGVWMVYYDREQTQLFCRAEIVEGNPVGKWLYHYSTGSRMKEFQFESGVWRGNMKRYYPDGSLHYEQVMDRTQDICGHRMEFDELGKLIGESFFLRDVLLQRIEYGNGAIKDAKAYNQGYHLWRKENKKRTMGQDVEGLIFRIYVGEYQDGIPSAKTKTLNRVAELKDYNSEQFVRSNSNGTKGYFIGEFDDFREAAEVAHRLKLFLFEGVQVIGFVNGKPIGDECVGEF